LKNPITRRAQGVGTGIEFKPQYQKKKETIVRSEDVTQG
jgi:hypothetical protein